MIYARRAIAERCCYSCSCLVVWKSVGLFCGVIIWSKYSAVSLTCNMLAIPLESVNLNDRNHISMHDMIVEVSNVNDESRCCSYNRILAIVD